MSILGNFPFTPLWVLISHRPFQSYLYRLISLPRKIGRIISSVLLRSSFVLQLAKISSRFAVVIINASLQPVKTPLLILISQSLSGVPYFSILALILCSTGDKITQELLSKVFSNHCFPEMLICLLFPCNTCARVGRV